MEKDLTKGSPFRLILAFLIPVALGELMQQIYSVMDAAIVGRYLGVLALGGVRREVELPCGTVLWYDICR